MLDKAQVIQESIAAIRESAEQDFRSRVQSQLRNIEEAQKMVNQAVEQLACAKKGLMEMDPPKLIDLNATLS